MDELEISGKRYISARRAAREHGYHPDYIGQLIRGKKIIGQKVGRSWYAEDRSLNIYLGRETSTTTAIIEEKKEEEKSTPKSHQESAFMSVESFLPNIEREVPMIIDSVRPTVLQYSDTVIYADVSARAFQGKTDTSDQRVAQKRPFPWRGAVALILIGAVVFGGLMLFGSIFTTDIVYPR